MAREKMPLMIGGNLHKGLFVTRNKKYGGYDLYIVWLDPEKEFASGQTYEMDDIQKMQVCLHFCDRESVKNTIKALEWILKQWKVVKHE